MSTSDEDELLALAGGEATNTADEAKTRATLKAHNDWVEEMLAKASAIGKAAVEAAIVGAASWVAGPGGALIGKGVAQGLTKITEAALTKLKKD